MITRTTVYTYTDDQGRDFELPIVDPYGYTDLMEADMIVTDHGDNVTLTYLVTDCDQLPWEGHYGEGEGFTITTIHSQRDADELSARLNDCAACGYHHDDHFAETNGGHDPEHWIGCDNFEPSDTRRALADGRAFLVERYEHGLVCYALRGEASQVDRAWDVNPIAGIVEADGARGDDADLEDAARSFLKRYTAWCNGDVYGVVHATYRMTDDGPELDDYDSCWGYLTYDYARQVMREEATTD